MSCFHIRARVVMAHNEVYDARPAARESIKSTLRGHIIINSFKAARFSQTRKKIPRYNIMCANFCTICGKHIQYMVRVRRVLRDFLDRLAENLCVQ